jgi:hypothetical protein
MAQRGLELTEIPVLGIPIVNGFKWIERLIKSIDYPIKNVIIMNNGNDPNLEDDLNELVKKGSPYVSSMKVVHFPSNMGVPFAWNFVIKSFLMEAYWLISNHDVAFTPGLLSEIAEAAKDKENCLIHPNSANFDLGSYDLFAITEKGVREIGLFDENLYPAYGEDSDFIMRAHNLKSKKVLGLSKDFIHGDGIAKEGDEQYLKNAQQTKKEDPSLAEKLDSVNLTNFEYLTQKWGEGWRWVQPHWNPFRNNEYPNTYTTWDLEFVRKKYLGF